MQATEVLKIVLEVENVLSGKFFVFNALDFSTRLLSFEKNPETAVVTELGQYADFCIHPLKEVRELTLEELYDMKREKTDLLLVDVREPFDRKPLGIDHISIPYYEISRNIDLISKPSAVVFYCSYGQLSARVIQYLQSEYKFNNLFCLTL